MTDAAASAPLLTIRDLRLETGSGKPILDRISLTLRPGEVLGIIGESGAGKSSLGLAALGYTRPGCRVAGGEVVFDGVDMLRAPEALRGPLRGTRIAYVAQSAAASFNPAYPLIDQATETGRIRGIFGRAEGEARIVDLFRAMRLPDPETIGRRYPHQVSGGQLQRAMTAMAMGCRPDVIVFDEPTTALDVTTQLEVLRSIRDVVERHRTAALYITHDLAVVAQMAHRIMVLRNGQLIEEAPVRSMLCAPKEDYTRSLWSVRHLRKAATSGPALSGSAAEAAPLLRVGGLGVRYGALRVLQDIALDVPRGAIVAIVGESGSGKSTFARTISGVLPQAEGWVEFDGAELPPARQARGRDLLRRIQMIYQSADTALNPRQSLEQIVGRPLTIHFGLRGRERRARVCALLDAVGLPLDRLSARPTELSGGQKQRLAIARALAADPDLFICDEITSALDQLVQKQILALLLRLQKETGKTFLFITHDIDTVRAIADHVVVMHRGRIVEQGPAETVLQAPRAAYTRMLLKAVPQMDPDWLDRQAGTGGEGRA